MDRPRKMLSPEDKKIPSKVFPQRNIKPSQTFTKDVKPKTSSQPSHAACGEVKKISVLPRGSAKDGESCPEKASSAGHRDQFENITVKPRAKKPKLPTSTNHNGNPVFLIIISPFLN